MTMPLNQNMAISAENLVPLAEIGGGPTVVGFPLDDIKSPRLWTFGRVQNSASASVTFKYEVPQKMQMFALLKHSLSVSSKWRIRVSETEASIGTPVYDTGWIPVYSPLTSFGILPWGEFDWGSVTLASYSTKLNVHAIHYSPEELTGRYVVIDIDDTSSPLLYIQIAHAYISQIYQPSANAEYGAESGVTDTTRTLEMESGSRRYGTLVIRRFLSVTLDLPYKEAFYKIFGSLYTAGISAPILVTLRPLEKDTYQFDSVYGNLAKPNPLKFANVSQAQTALYIDEAV
jgi:hypothetical protein